MKTLKFIILYLILKKKIIYKLSRVSVGIIMSDTLKKLNKDIIISLVFLLFTKVQWYINNLHKNISF